MNYLIHFLLAGDDDELRLGNLLGDHVKGRVERFEHPGLTGLDENSRRYLRGTDA